MNLTTNISNVANAISMRPWCPVAPVAIAVDCIGGYDYIRPGKNVGCVVSNENDMS